MIRPNYLYPFNKLLVQHSTIHGVFLCLFIPRYLSQRTLGSSQRLSQSIITLASGTYTFLIKCNTRPCIRHTTFSTVLHNKKNKFIIYQTNLLVIMYSAIIQSIMVSISTECSLSITYFLHLVNLDNGIAFKLFRFII